MKRGSSLRLIEWPIPPTSAVVRGSMVSSSLPKLGRRVLDGLHDVHVARTAAEVARDRVPDVALGGRLVLAQERNARHHHAGRAVAALEAVLLPEAFLDRM